MSSAVDPISARLMRVIDDFLDQITTEVLVKAGGATSKTLLKDKNFRLDFQGPATSFEPQAVNLQLQVNKESRKTTLKKLKGASIGIAFAPSGDSPLWRNGGYHAINVREDLRRTLSTAEDGELEQIGKVASQLATELYLERTKGYTTLTKAKGKLTHQ